MTWLRPGGVRVWCLALLPLSAAHFLYQILYLINIIIVNNNISFISDMKYIFINFYLTFGDLLQLHVNIIIKKKILFVVKNNYCYYFIFHLQMT